MKLEIATNLSASAALAAGCTEHGYLTVAPTSEQVGALSDEQRKRLARYVVPRHGNGSSLHVTAPGWPGVVAALDSEMAKEREQETKLAAQVQAEIESYRRMLEAPHQHEPGTMPPVQIRHDVAWHLAPNYSRDNDEAKRLWSKLEARIQQERRQMIAAADAGLTYDVVSGELAEPIRSVLRALKDGEEELAPRAVEFRRRLSAERVAAELAEREAHAAAVRELVERHGAPDQIERHQAGVLPSDELERLIVQALFVPLAALPHYDEISEQEVADECECDLDDVKFSTSTIARPELSAEQFAALKAIRAAAPSGAVVEVREHVGYERGHTDADDPEIRRLSARVTIEFAGERYRQEYAI